jgi:hypothetical protein
MRLSLISRVIGKDVGATLVIVLSLAIGIGANSAIFSVVDALLLRPLPYPEPSASRRSGCIRRVSASFAIGRRPGSTLICEMRTTRSTKWRSRNPAV